jgi:hypothetical protein
VEIGSEDTVLWAVGIGGTTAEWVGGGCRWGGVAEETGGTGVGYYGVGAGRKKVGIYLETKFDGKGEDGEGWTFVGRSMWCCGGGGGGGFGGLKS